MRSTWPGLLANAGTYSTRSTVFISYRELDNSITVPERFDYRCSPVACVHASEQVCIS